MNFRKENRKKINTPNKKLRVRKDYLLHFPALHFPLAAHFLVIFFVLHLLPEAHFPLAAHFVFTLASLLCVHPVNPTIAKPTKAVNTNFFISYLLNI